MAPCFYVTREDREWAGVGRVGGRGWGCGVGLSQGVPSKMGCDFLCGFQEGLCKNQFKPQGADKREAGLVYALKHEWAMRWPLLDPVAQKWCHLTSVLLWLGEAHPHGS